MRTRIVQAELLDTLPPEHPEARQSRRDLRRINLVTGSHRWLARTLTARVSPGESVLELGAGTGELARRLAGPGVVIDGLDRCPPPDDRPPGMRWHQADLRSFTGWAGYAGVVGNLVFHQFSDRELARLGHQLQRCARLIVASEPARRRFSQVLFRWLAPCFGAGHVTLHDARVSIAAGFRGDELPALLGLDPVRWHWRCTATALGTYRMIARLRDDAPA